MRSLGLGDCFFTSGTRSSITVPTAGMIFSMRSLASGQFLFVYGPQSNIAISKPGPPLVPHFQGPRSLLYLLVSQLPVQLRLRPFCTVRPVSRVGDQASVGATLR